MVRWRPRRAGPVSSPRARASRASAFRRWYRTVRSRRGSLSLEVATVSAEVLRALRVVPALAVLAAVSGCLDPVDPGDAAVAMVQVTFDGTNAADTIQVREMTRAHAAAVAEQGYNLGRTDFIFSSSNEAVAVVEPTGVVRAIAPGEAVIRATLRGGIVGEGRVVVVPSTVAYTIPVGAEPGAMAFSPDYTRLYVSI